jgi:hypothetical protein
VGALDVGHRHQLPKADGVELVDDICVLELPAQLCLGQLNPVSVLAM